MVHPYLQAPYQFPLLTVLAYLVLCRLLRFTWMYWKHAQYPYKDRASFAKMTMTDAQDIQWYLYQLEFPFTTQKALEFALFRTYGIPAVSKLLVQTKQLSDKKNAPKRYVDTVVLIGEFMANPPEAQRTIDAISRMNYIHSVYQKQKLISNENMLYTLSLFALEPIRWVKRYEWREMTSMEVCAMGTFWKAMGDAMEISYKDLPSFKTGWRDGLHWLEEVKQWSIDYEKQSMVPHHYNHQTANETTAILLWDLPESWIPFGRQVLSSLMDDRLRKAMMYDAPPSWLQSFIDWALWIRKYLLRYVALPRPYFMAAQFLSKEPDENGRYHRLVYESEPWYCENNWKSRNTLQSWIKWLGGKPIPDGKNYKPEGYLIPEIGPKSLDRKGKEEFEATSAKLTKQSRGGCPFVS